MIRRVLSFDTQDWKHVSWLFGDMCISALKLDFHEAREAYIFMKLHFTHDSTRIEEEEGE